MRVWGMRQGINVDVGAAYRVHLEAVVADRNSPQKYIWRARIVLLTAEGGGTVVAETARERELRQIECPGL